MSGDDRVLGAHGEEAEEHVGDIGEAVAAELLGAELEEGSGGEVENNKVGLFAGVEAADVAVEVEGAGAAEGGEEEELEAGDGLVAELGDLVGLVGGGEHGE